LLEMVVAVMGV